MAPSFLSSLPPQLLLWALVGGVVLLTLGFIVGVAAASTGRRVIRRDTTELPKLQELQEAHLRNIELLKEEKARLQEAARQQVQLFKYICTVLEEEPLRARIIQIARERVQVPVAAYFQFEPDSPGVKLAAQEGLSPFSCALLRNLLSEMPSLRTFAKPLTLKKGEKGFGAFEQLEERVSVVLTVPLRHEGEILGFLFLARTQAGAPFSPEEVDTLQELSAPMSMALHNARRFAQARGPA
ncbi:MAG: GAF domain-containing protein [Armatimonadetes bacterium]|nr:GAF domain-containing protein [Armatimonadota bacterium]